MNFDDTPQEATFRAEARDFDDLKGPNLGKSRELRLRIVSDEDAGRQLDDLRREIREETARVLAMQEQARAPVEDALRSLTRAGKVAAPQRELLGRLDEPARPLGVFLDIQGNSPFATTSRPRWRGYGRSKR